ncbi:hypothetical protein DFH09DRAFT_1353362 [Mycena vulgaris]|nr:hypothetical protein DFH09DRAFT_1353362 [Mycena vulgaris]
MGNLMFLNAILDAASRGWSRRSPVPRDKIRYMLEWSWGLEYGTLDEHVNKFSDPHLADIMMDDNLILVAHSALVRKIYLLASNLPLRATGLRTMVQDIYEDCKSFEYLVLPVDASSGITPRLLISSVPPHLTIPTSVDKLLKRWVDFDAAGDSLITLVETSPPTGATFIPDSFMRLRYTHEAWATCYVSSRFLGLEDSDEGEDVDDAESSTMEWEVQTLSYSDEPSRRLLPHEFDQEPIVKIHRVPSTEEEDDAISYDSYITGADDPEAYAKAIASGGYEADSSWLEGIESWAESAKGFDDEMMLNEGQIEEDSKEGPRVVTSLDLDKPDYLSKPKLLSKRKIGTPP